VLKTRARKATIRIANAQMRQIDPDIPRFLPQGGPASHIIRAVRKHKRQKLIAQDGDFG